MEWVYNFTLVSTIYFDLLINKYISAHFVIGKILLIITCTCKETDKLQTYMYNRAANI